MTIFPINCAFYCTLLSGIAAYSKYLKSISKYSKYMWIISKYLWNISKYCNVSKYFQSTVHSITLCSVVWLQPIPTKCLIASLLMAIVGQNFKWAKLHCILQCSLWLSSETALLFLDIHYFWIFTMCHQIAVYDIIFLIAD